MHPILTLLELEWTYGVENGTNWTVCFTFNFDLHGLHTTCRYYTVWPQCTTRQTTDRAIGIGRERSSAVGLNCHVRIRCATWRLFDVQDIKYSQVCFRYALNLEQSDFAWIYWFLITDLSLLSETQMRFRLMLSSMSASASAAASAAVTEWFFIISGKIQTTKASNTKI